MVSPLAYIHPEAKIGENVEIAPFVFIDKNVVIGDNNKIMANVNILYGSRIGNGNTIFPGAVIGAVPQDLKFRGEESTAEIGDNNLIRENVTVNRGTAAKGRTIVGSNNLLMEGVHVAHDALIGNGCIIGNSTKMAGEIVIDDNAIISANVLMHQFCHVGSHVMIQGGCRFSKDIPPYIIAGREPIAFSGINIIGLRRRGFANEVIESIHNAYRIIYQSGLNTTDALKKDLLPIIADENNSKNVADALEKDPLNAIENTVNKTNSVVGVKLVLSQMITQDNSSDDMVYNNMVELVKSSNTVGRRMAYSVAGNQDPTIEPQEIDADDAQEINILPPFGQNYIYYILGFVVAVILIAGIAITIKIVKKK